MYQKCKVVSITGLLVINIFYAQGQGNFRLQESLQLYGKRIAVTTRMLEKHGDSLYINQRYDMAALHLPSKCLLTLTPILRSPSGDSLRLPEIIILGRNRYKAYKRRIALKKKSKEHAVEVSAYAILENDEPKWNLQYIYTVPYENWMSGAILEMKEEMSGYRGWQKTSVEYVATVR